jgi:hypothetical protein
VRAPARSLLVPGGIVAAVASAHALDLSFSLPVLNFLAVLAAMLAGGALALLSFGMGPRWLGIPLGLLGSGGWLVACSWIVATAVFDGNDPVDTELGDGLLCRRAGYGFVTGDSGQELALYRRVLIVDRRIHDEQRSDVYPASPEPPPAGLRDALARCRTAAPATTPYAK